MTMLNRSFTFQINLISINTISLIGHVFSLLVVCLVLIRPIPSYGTTTTRILPSGKGVELLVDGPNGQYKDILPVYTVQGAPYFSAGVGQEERDAIYPPYSLKLEFLLQGGAFTGLVDLVFKRKIDRVEFSIPKDHAKGPWFFINLPPGVYSVTGVRHDRSQTKDEIEVVSGLPTKIQLIWDK